MDRSVARADLLALALPDAVTAIFDGELPHPALRFRCTSPLHVFSIDAEDLGMSVTPLWECGVRVTAYSPSVEGGRFIRFSLESPDSVDVLGGRFACAVADLMIDLWEDEKSEAALLEVADLFGFASGAQLIALCESRNDARDEEADEPEENYFAWRAGVLARFDGAS